MDQSSVCSLCIGYTVQVVSHFKTPVVNDCPLHQKKIAWHGCILHCKPFTANNPLNVNSHHSNGNLSRVPVMHNSDRDATHCNQLPLSFTVAITGASTMYVITLCRVSKQNACARTKLSL